MQITVTNETDLRELINKDDPEAKSALLFFLIPVDKASISRVGFNQASVPTPNKTTLKVEYQGKYVTGYYIAQVTENQYELLVNNLKKLRNYTFIQTFKLTAPLAINTDNDLIDND
ncbi:hypothetical protein [Loigolactobacillus zhaoyuanensis]|uniref:Uncharacterized protein n=1 Tax=Loigolactobacillus zhaoyuanensis TaxID=2486017 RepID=A0ABW8UES9_9LACO